MMANPFAVAVEALKERLHALENYAVSLRDVEATLADTRAALAVFDRLASVEVAIEKQGGVVEPRVFVLARIPRQHRAEGFYGASLLHVWQPEDHDQAEVEAVAHIIAAIECRTLIEAQS
jgi:hypothetical protein